MGKAKSVFVCSACGYESAKWMGKCTACNEWNTFIEEVVEDNQKKASIKSKNAEYKNLQDVSYKDDNRKNTHIGELDRVLGGGIVNGSVVLIGGDPGIGKSTLLLQVLAKAAVEYKCLYITGEESVEQIKLRAKRLGLAENPLYVLAETNLDEIEAQILNLNPSLIVLDSIQTMYTPNLSSSAGSVSQVREATSILMRLAKVSGCTLFIVGHVTKDGSLAGPRVLEHMVDTVLYFEGERHSSFRIIRAVKNRFGSTNEIGVFEMTDKGMVEIENPSKVLLEGSAKGLPGMAVICSLEGTRPVLIEVQALLTKTYFPSPRRMSTGIDYNRVMLLMAVLEKKLGMPLYEYDAYVNIAGGLKVDEPATDLGLIASVISSYKNKPVSNETAIIGEVGLLGEVRAVSQMEVRLKECYKMGFKTCIIPADNKIAKVPAGLNVIYVNNVAQLVNVLF